MINMDINKLYNILLSDNPSEEVIKNDVELFKLIPELKTCKGFNQNNPWHIYDVYVHTLHVLDAVKPELSVRMAALFHDIGKPIAYKEDEHGIGHFHGHWEESQKIFEEFASKHNLDEDIASMASYLIYYHDLNLSKVDDDVIDYIYNLFKDEGIELLFDLKEADLYAHAEKYHYYIDNINRQRERITSRSCKR